MKPVARVDVDLFTFNTNHFLTYEQYETDESSSPLK